MILSEFDVKAEIQIERCKAMCEEYFRGQQIRIDYKALYSKLDPYPLLFQFTHLIAFHFMHWQDALRWVMDHKDEVLDYDRKIRNEQERPAPSKTDGENDRNDALSADKG